MSASLVGSEMCIRDSSTWKRPTSLQMSSQPALALSGTSILSRRVASVRFCLLYTSDAADDM
eukprot:13846175-Alexandrium_andersonii.AAC.1